MTMGEKSAEKEGGNLADLVTEAWRPEPQN